jgi:xanthine dehydrogenase accessory factor
LPCDGSVTLQATATPAQFSFDGQHMRNTLGPGYRMLLIGAGALAEYLATMALFNGFRVAVCDPRPEYLASWAVAGVEHLAGMPDDVVRLRADLRSCVIAVSHDPKLDDLALLEALHSPAFYVGAIGSRRNSQLRRERLIEHLARPSNRLSACTGRSASTSAARPRRKSRSA